MKKWELELENENLIKKWYHPELKIMEELNKEGFVYAWMIPPALPEVK